MKAFERLWIAEIFLRAVMLEDLPPLGKTGEVGCRVPLRKGLLICPSMVLIPVDRYIGTSIQKDFTQNQ